MRRVAALVVLAALAAIPGTAQAAGQPPWRAAGELRDALFDAQTELIVGTPATAQRAVARARAAYAGRLRAGVRAADRSADRAAQA
ncbi:MAG TPA: hypothetical protein VI006_00695, partial [Solirubrobacteraceae bacterium]